LHASNLLWSDAGDQAEVTAIIDFGLADRTNAVHDIAHAIERNIVEWLELGKNQIIQRRFPCTSIISTRCWTDMNPCALSLTLRPRRWRP